MTTKDVILKVQVQGNAAGELKKVAGEGKKVTDTFAKSRGTKDFEGLEKAIGKSSKGLLAFDVMLGKVNKTFKQNTGAQVLTQLQKQAAAATKETERLAAAQAKANRAQRGDPLQAMAMEAQHWANEREKKRREHEAHKKHAHHGFAMGVLQGAEMGEYFPEHGLVANFAGRKVGGMLRTAKEAAMTPFTGMEGFRQTAGAIPLVGGLIAAELGKAESYVQQHQAAASQKMGQMLYQERSPTTAEGEKRARDAAEAAVAENMQLIRSTPDEASSTATIPGHFINGKFIPPQTITTPAKSGSQTYTDANADARAEAGNAAAERYREEHPDPFETMREVGGKFGLDPTAAREAGGQFMAGLGGTFGQIDHGGRSRELLETAYAAQTRYGVSMEASSAFGRGGKSGAMGAAGGNEAFMSALRQAINLGLTGSDMTKYMEQMAGDIRSFETTGMPLAQEALAGIQNGLAGAMGGLRASNVSRGILSASQGVAENGASSAAQYMMLQEMGGFRGGGIDAYFDAQKTLRSGGIAGGLDSLLQRAQIFGSDKGNAMGVQSMLKELGVSINEDEALAYVGGNKAYSQRWAASLGGGKGLTAESMAKEGEEWTPEGKKRAAEEAGIKEGIGARMEKMVQDLEAASTATSDNFSHFGRQLGTLTGKVEHLAKEAGPFFDKVVNFIDAVNKRING